MPVNMDVSNSIISAFNQGYQENLAKQKFAQEKQEHADRLKQEDAARQQALDIATKQLEQSQQQFDSRQKFEKVTQDIQAAIYKQQLAEQVAKTGYAPDTKITQGSFSQPRQEESGATNAPIPTDLSGIPQGQIQIDSPILGKFNVPTPEAAAQQQGRVTEITQGPLEARKIREQAAAQKEILDREAQLQGSKNQFEAGKTLAEIAGRENVARINAAARMNAAKISGTSDKSIALAKSISDKFDSNDVTKRYTLLKSAAQNVNSINDNTKNPQDDQALIYAFAKAMDPTSAVREGEYATVQRYAQSMADRFGFTLDRLTKNAPFLTPEARKNIKATITNRAKIEESAYKNLTNEVGKKLQTVGAKPEDWLTDYGTVDSGYAPNESRTLKDGTSVVVHKNLKSGKFEEVGP